MDGMIEKIIILKCYQVFEGLGTEEVIGRIVDNKEMEAREPIKPRFLTVNSSLDSNF